MAEMTELKRNLLGLATGVVFGALLRRGGLDDSRTIVGQFTGDDSRVAKTMGSAVAVGALGHQILVRRGYASPEPKPLNPLALVAGSVLFGVGMAVSGVMATGSTAVSAMALSSDDFPALKAPTTGIKSSLLLTAAFMFSIWAGSSPNAKPADWAVWTSFSIELR